MATLKSALQEVCYMELEDIPSEESLSTDDSLTFSAAFERKMKKLIRRADHPVRYRAAQAAACILLAVLLNGCTVLALSPTARAAAVRWVMEWYGNNIDYRYTGEQNTEELPQYEITELPDGYVEAVRDVAPGFVVVTYENQNADVIYFDYNFMHQGTQTNFILDDDDVYDVMVNQMNGQFIESRIPGNLNSLTWIDSELSIQFTISGCLDLDSFLHMAEYISLCKLPK